MFFKCSCFLPQNGNIICIRKNKCLLWKGMKNSCRGVRQWQDKLDAIFKEYERKKKK